MNITRINPNIKQMELVAEAYTEIQTQDNLSYYRKKDNTLNAGHLIKLQDAYDAYDDLVDELVDVTEGNALAVDIDPLTYYRDKSRERFFGLTYNEMAEIVGQEAFGE